MEEEISLVEILDILKKQAKLILGLSLVGLMFSAVFTFFIAVPQYSSKTQLLVSRTETTQYIQQSDINTNLQLINTYKDIIKGPVILDEVREKLNVDMSHEALSNQVQIETGADSQVFSISITGDNPNQAALVANTIAETFRDKIGDLMKVDNVSIISKAVPNRIPVSPNKPLNLVIGLLLGFMIGVGLAFLMAFFDTTIKDDRFITEELGWVTLGHVQQIAEEELKQAKRTTQIKQNAKRSTRSRV